MQQRPRYHAFVGTYVRVRSFSFTITEHDPDRPWIVTGVEQRTVELEDDLDFFAWAAERWPAKRFTIQLDPWELSRSLDDSDR
jgi:hypothetical protein